MQKFKVGTFFNLKTTISTAIFLLKIGVSELISSKSNRWTFSTLFRTGVGTFSLFIHFLPPPQPSHRFQGYESIFPIFFLLFFLFLSLRRRRRTRTFFTIEQTQSHPLPLVYRLPLLRLGPLFNPSSPTFQTNAPTFSTSCVLVYPSDAHLLRKPTTKQQTTDHQPPTTEKLLL